MNPEYKKMMNELKTIPYSEKTEWQKAIVKFEVKESRQRKQQRKFEQLCDPNTFDYKDFEGV